MWPLTSLVPKGPFRPRGPRWIQVEIVPTSSNPHRVTSNDLVGCGLEQFRPHGWRLSHDVATRLMFSSGAYFFSPPTVYIPITKEQPQSTRSERSVVDVRPFIIIGLNRRSDPASGVPPCA